MNRQRVYRRGWDYVVCDGKELEVWEAMRGTGGDSILECDEINRLSQGN